jgi:hypothetical protein
MVIISVFMLVTVSAANLKDSDMRNTATNIANYTVEYLRARNVTYPDNPLGHAVGDFGNDTAHSFPGLVDYSSVSSALKPGPDLTSTTINIKPATPNQTYNGHFDSTGILVPGGGKSEAFYSSLQGYVSLANSPADSNLSSEDGNAKVVSGKYCDIITGALYVVQFPFTATDLRAIKNFTALTGYNPKIYTSDTDKSTNTNSPKYDLHYTGTKTNTMAYTGFRVLTQIVARKALAAVPDHVQYYDVQVTVFWVLGNTEHSYSVATQITTYGGS